MSRGKIKDKGRTRQTGEENGRIEENREEKHGENEEKTGKMKNRKWSRKGE